MSNFLVRLGVFESRSDIKSGCFYLKRWDLQDLLDSRELQAINVRKLKTWQFMFPI